MIWWQAIILLFSGVIVAMACMVLGAYIMFKAKSPDSNSGFLREPKGDVFSIPDETSPDFLNTSGEPSADEKRVLEKTNEFLKTLGG